jgi:membrane protein YqaA with SNARE-associated domain
MYDRTLQLGSTRHAVWVLAAVAFAESSVFPIPPDVLLIPMILAVRQRAWTLAGICTAASVLGGFLGYAIGALLFDVVGQPIIDFYGFELAFARFTAQHNEAGAWIVAFFGVTPFPYKVITIASGVTHLDPVVFGIASLGSRALRFFIVAALLWYFGPPIRDFVERYLGWVVLVFCVLLIGGFVVLKFLL